MRESREEEGGLFRGQGGAQQSSGQPSDSGRTEYGCSTDSEAIPQPPPKKKERPGRDSEEETTGAGSLVEGVLAEGTSLSSTQTGAEDRRASLVLQAPSLVLRPHAASCPHS